MVGRTSGHQPPSQVGRTPELDRAGSSRQAGGSETAIVTIDENGVIVDFDQAAERLLGYSRAAAVGAVMGELIVPSRLRAAHEAGLRRYREIGLAPILDDKFQVPALCQDGREIRVELTVSRVTAGGRPGFAGQIREISRCRPVPAEIAPSTDFHRTVLDKSPITISVFEEDGTYVWATPSAQQVESSARGQPIEQLIETLVHPEDAETARIAYGQAVTVGLSEPVDLRMRDADGSWREWSVLTRNLLDHPAVHGLVLYGIDVTRARVAEQQQRVEATRMMTLLEALTVGVMLQDEHRRVVLSNAALVDLFDLRLPLERLLGATDDGHGYLYPDTGKTQPRIDEIIERGERVVGEEVQLINNRVVERDYTPITMDDTVLGHLWVFRDITAQAEIRRGLEERNRSLSELATLKSEFITVVSHELRTPLTSINTFASILTDDADLTAEERATAMTALRRNADHMMSLVADLILLAKLESSELTLSPEPLELATLIREAVASGDGTDAGIRLTAEVIDGPPVIGDPALLGQLVDTVIGVLVAVSAPGACVRVRAYPEAPGWRLQVATTAVDAATAERLLSARLPHPDSVGEHRTGALALMLGRAIASRHSGELSMTVTRPGAHITVTLPLDPHDTSSQTGPRPEV